MNSSSGAHRQQADAYFLPVESTFGTLHIVWQGEQAGPMVTYISLPNEPRPTTGTHHGARPVRAIRSCPRVDQLAERIRLYLTGEPICFSLGLMAMERCGGFQREVLLAEYAIPRGEVSTYGRVGNAIGRPGSARAVGQALARNPFPLVIPCHRAVRSDGRLGGYRGGLAMKRALLRLEGVDVDARDRVRVGSYYY